MKAFSFLRRFVGREALVRIDERTWDALVDELGRRGGGVRESGAFLLASKDGGRRTVTDVIYFDDLDDKALTGAIHLRSRAFSRLWRICREHRLMVVADVHTHPGPWVEQSGIDMANPMVARDGHIALILPDLARGSRKPKDAGFHIYRGEDGWEPHLGRHAAQRLYVGRFA
jgi:hypothetical protein